MYDAYELLTGRRLPQPVPVAAPEMALDEPTARALDGEYRERQRRLADEWATLLQLQQAGNLPRLLIAMARHAQARGEAAEQLHRAGAPAAAYAKVLEAWVHAASATDTYDILQKARRGDARRRSRRSTRSTRSIAPRPSCSGSSARCGRPRWAITCWR